MGKLCYIYLFCSLLAGSFYGHAQTGHIAIPKFNDAYSRTVAKLESGKTDIDFRKFRFSFLDSRQYDVKMKQHKQFIGLRNELYAQAYQQHYKEVIAISKKLLSIDYTYLYAHKYLWQSYRLIGDSANMKKYQAIERGLLQSIVGGNSGRTCKTSWEVSQLYEEYFMLDIIRAEMLKQSIVQCSGRICDDLEVKADDGKIKHCYFEITRMIKKTQQKLSGKKKR